MSTSIADIFEGVLGLLRVGGGRCWLQAFGSQTVLTCARFRDDSRQTSLKYFPESSSVHIDANDARGCRATPSPTS